MFALLRRLLPVIGLLLIALAIWFGGPYIGFTNGFVPFESVTARLVLIALVVAIWAGVVVSRQLRARRASDQLAAAVVQQAQKAEPRPSADVVQLRERFEEAVATLKQKRASGHTLYELPWYVIIGAPGSGKTTALMNSGLQFPLEQRTGKAALRGVGGTRNCDWWFTDEAILLDTAGRYTTQDSDASADSAGWAEFLALLKKYRKRRPINGVLLTISAQDLMVQGAGALEGHIDAARRRLTELYRELGIQLPVYVLVTKCDLIAGFTEYFDDLSQEGRAQVWGVTFPYEQTLKGEATKAFPAEFDALMTRLNERVFARVEDDREPRRRARVFGFPQQMASLRDMLAEFVGEVFATTRFDQQILLRGVYFTSGTQEGNPIDRLLGAIGRRFAVAPDAVMQPTGRGKAYFIERLLKEVVFAESGLAGVNRRFEFQMAAAQMGLYVALAAVTILAVVLWSVSYARNRNFIEAVNTDVAALAQSPPVPADPSFAATLPRLNQVRAVYTSANQYNDDIPWSRRWGLYQGRSMAAAAHDAYVRELDHALMPRIQALLRQRLVDVAARPEELHDYLKAYLMLGQPDRFQKDHFGKLMEAELKAAYAASPETAQQLVAHFGELVQNEDRLRPLPLDEARVRQAQNTLQNASIPRIVFGAIKSFYVDDPRALRIDEKIGIAAAQVLRRKSGRPLSDPVPAIFTKGVFEEVTSKSATDLIKQYNDDRWVWGDTRPSMQGSVELSNQVVEVYEQEYIRYWDGVLSDFSVSFGPDKTAEALAVLAGPSSPLRSFFTTVAEQTNFTKPAAPAATPGLIERQVDRFEKLVERGQQAAGIVPRDPGAAITKYFAPIHNVVAGEPGTSAMDRVLGTIRDLQQEMAGVGAGQIGGTGAVANAANSKREQLVSSLQQDADTLPPVVGDLVSGIASTAAGAFRVGVRNELQALYAQEVVQPCRDTINNKYPFVRESQIYVTPEDFGELFGFDGTFDRFFKKQVEQLVNTLSRPWTWRKDATGASVGTSEAMLRQFESAQRIRDRFFQFGSRMPQVRFTITVVELNAAASKVSLEMNGERSEFQFGAPRTLSVAWPGPQPAPAALVFTDRGGRPTSLAHAGPWAWLRLIQDGEVTSRSDTEFVVTWRSGAHSAVAEIQAASRLNPFTQTDLQNFRCG